MLVIGVRSRGPDCLLERSVNAALAGALRDAEAALEARLAEITLAELADEVRRGAHARGPRDRPHPQPE